MTEGEISSILLQVGDEQQLIVLNRGGTITTGVESGDYYIASDIELVKQYTTNIMHLNNNSVAIINDRLDIKH